MAKDRPIQFSLVIYPSNFQISFPTFSAPPPKINSWNLNLMVWFRWFSSSRGTLQWTNISPTHGILKMIFFFPRWDMLVSWRVYPQVPAVNLPGKIPFQRKTTTPWCRGTHFWPLCALWVTPKPRKKVDWGAVSFDALIPSGCKWCFCYFCWFKWRCVLFKAIYLLTYCNHIGLGWKNTWNIKTNWLLISIYEISIIRD